MKKTWILLIVIFLYNCQAEKKKSTVLDRNTYKKVLKELILTNVVKQQLEKEDTTAKYLLYLVYKKYHIDSLKLKESTDYYSNHPEILAEIYKEIYEDLKQKSDSLQKLSPPKKPKTDKINISKKALKQSKK